MMKNAKNAVVQHWRKIATVIAFLGSVAVLLVAMDVNPVFWAWSSETKELAEDVYSDQMIRARRERSALEEQARQLISSRQRVPQWLLRDLEDVRELIKILDRKRKKL